MVRLYCMLYNVSFMQGNLTIHILKFAFKFAFASLDDVRGMARSTFCIADPAMQNDGLDSNVPI